MSAPLEPPGAHSGPPAPEQPYEPESLAGAVRGDDLPGPQPLVPPVEPPQEPPAA
jgi:hypothetical protein